MKYLKTKIKWLKNFLKRNLKRLLFYFFNKDLIFFIVGIMLLIFLTLYLLYSYSDMMFVDLPVFVTLKCKTCQRTTQSIYKTWIRYLKWLFLKNKRLDL
jgi:hypothetical protein